MFALLALLAAGGVLGYEGLKSAGVVGPPPTDPAAKAAAKAARKAARMAPVINTDGVAVAPSIPGHQIPCPNPAADQQRSQFTDTSPIPVGTSGTSIINPMLGLQMQAKVIFNGQGMPFVDRMGYYRDSVTGNLFQFFDPNTGRPIGKPGYMPNRYAAYCQQQQLDSLAGQIAAEAAAGSGDASDIGATIGQIGQTVATGVAVASTAADAAPAIAAGIGAVAACLGPIPVGSEEGWYEPTVRVRVVFERGRALQLAIARTGQGWVTWAIEVDATARRTLATDPSAALAAMYADHDHQPLGVDAHECDAVRRIEEYAREWRSSARRCNCPPIALGHTHP